MWILGTSEHAKESYLTLDRDRFRIIETIPATLPSLPEIRAQVEGAWRADASVNARARGMREARAGVEVRLEVVE